MSLAHHWTPMELGALTVEQLRLWQAWQLPLEPTRVGREEARALLSARLERRQAWVRGVLTKGASCLPSAVDGLAPNGRELGQRVDVASGVAAWVADGSGAATRDGQSFARRRDARPAAAGARHTAHNVEHPLRPSNTVSEGPARPADLRLEQGLMTLASQLERLERRLSRGAPLGP